MASGSEPGEKKFRGPQAPPEVTSWGIKMFFYCNFSTKKKHWQIAIKHRSHQLIIETVVHWIGLLGYSRLLYSNLAVSLIHSNLDFVNICNCNPAHTIIRRWLRVWSSDEIIWRNTTTAACVLRMTCCDDGLMGDHLAISRGLLQAPWTLSKQMFRGGRQVFQVGKAPSGPAVIRPLVWTSCCVGNDNLHLLTSNARQRLRIDLADFQRNTKYAEYDNFAVHAVQAKFNLSSLGTYRGTAGKYEVKTCTTVWLLYGLWTDYAQTLNSFATHDLNRAHWRYNHLHRRTPNKIVICCVYIYKNRVTRYRYLMYSVSQKRPAYFLK